MMPKKKKATPKPGQMDYNSIAAVKKRKEALKKAAETAKRKKKK